MADTTQEAGVRERVIRPTSIEVENRSGYDVLVVEDSAGNRYTTLDDELVEEVPKNRQKYLGSTWKLLWSLTKEGFTNFHGFDEEVDEEPEEEEIEAEVITEMDVRITRQSAGHGATRIVSGKLASGERMSDEEIARELKKWTDYLKNYYRSGEWDG